MAKSDNIAAVRTVIQASILVNAMSRLHGGVCLQVYLLVLLVFIRFILELEHRLLGFNSINIE